MYLNKFSQGILRQWSLATYWLQTSVRGTFPKCSMHRESAAFLLKTFQLLLDKYVKEGWEGINSNQAHSPSLATCQAPF